MVNYLSIFILITWGDIIEIYRRYVLDISPLVHKNKLFKIKNHNKPTATKSLPLLQKVHSGFLVRIFHIPGITSQTRYVFGDSGKVHKKGWELQSTIV